MLLLLLPVVVQQQEAVRVCPVQAVGTGVPAACHHAARSHLLYLALALLLQLVRDRLVRRRAPLRMVELALVAVGALFVVGTGRRQLAGRLGFAQESVQGGSIAAERVVRRHKSEHKVTC